MKVPITIPKAGAKHQSEDYAFLRQEGMAYIEQLASDLWTDYNVHDPGITTLEALCYAITDLGYRTSFEMRDLLARPGDDLADPDPPIFTAREILTSEPWTLLDWRKLLADIEGVQNAWLFKADQQEVDFYADCKTSRLRYFSPDYLVEEKPHGKKLTDILHDWIDDPANMENERMVLDLFLEYQEGIPAITRRLRAEVPLPGWEEINTRLTDFLPFINLQSVQSIQILTEDYDNQSGIWEGAIRIGFVQADGSNGALTLPSVVVTQISETVIRDALVQELTLNSAGNVFVRYQQYLRGRLARRIEHSIRIRGLYDVLLEYEVEEAFGDLNSDLLDHSITVGGLDGRPRLHSLEALLPSWRTIWDDLPAWYAFLQSPAITSVQLENVRPVDDRTRQADLVLQYQGQNGNPDIRLDEVVFLNIPDDTVFAALKMDLQSLTEGSLPGRFHAKLKRLLAITQAVEERLHEHRSLCEDFFSVAAICVNKIGLCADVDVAPEANLEDVLAEIYFQVERYLSPPVRFYTLREMVDQKAPAEDIFDGPPLDHGFIRGEELETSALPDYRFVYVSDIINLIMDIPGVRSVSNALITKYDKRGRPVLPSQPWCLRLDYRHKAHLGIEGESNIQFFKDGLPYFVRGAAEQNMRKKLRRLETIHDRSKLPQTETDFPAPAGAPLPLDQYSPLRMIFPVAYGIGRHGLPESAGPERRARARQLRSYLAFCDQLLINYLGQLSHLRELFSLDDSLVKTYFSRFLAESELGDGMYVDPVALEDAGNTLGPNSLQRLVESEKMFWDRRNRFLDHLMARFAERFSEYTLLMNTVSGIRDPNVLVQDKIDFLKDYPAISRRRGQGFNYRDETALWDTDNVPGLQRRAARLLGVDDFTRRDLHCPTLRDGFQIDDLGGGLWGFHLEEGSQDILAGLKTYPTADDAFYAKEELIELGQSIENYEVRPSGAKFRFYLGRRQDPATLDAWMESHTDYSAESDAQTAAEDFLRRFSADFGGEDPCEVEGLHVVEHLLLRPKHEFADRLFPVCLHEDCFFCGEEDPYSFRVTVVLPYWMDRFIDRDMKFREYAERILRLEAPAHVHVKICWVDNAQLRLFEVHYRHWLEENARRFPDPVALTRRLNALIDVLTDLRSVYPEGRLHDCDDRTQENTIILSKSYLGQFDPGEEDDV